MSGQNTFDDFDDDLRRLFNRSAAQVEPQRDFMAGVQQRLTQGGAIHSGGARRSFSIVATLSALVVVALLAGVLAALNRSGGRPGGTGGPLAPTATVTHEPTAATTPFTVSSVELSVNPASIAGATCGSVVHLTYTAVFHIPANTAGGTVQFGYSLNNGRSSTSASVVAGAGATSASYTFTSSGALPADHTYPGAAIVMVTSPNSVLSPAITPAGSCVTAVTAPFQVKSVSMSVSPSSIAGKACGTDVTVTYTATFHLAANGPGGTIVFDYTVNNGRGNSPASLQVAAGRTTASYSFVWSGPLPADHTYPESGGVITSSPNAVNSPLVGPSGTCS